MKLFELQSTAEVTELEQQLDKMFATLGLDVEFTRHFIERLLGRERSVTVEDIVNSFNQLKSKYKSRLLKAKRSGQYDAILRDFDRDLNIVFAIKPGQDGPELLNITIKKKDPSTFVTSQAGGEDLRVGSKRVQEDEIPAMGNTGDTTPIDQKEQSIATDDERNNKPPKVTNRGKNHKTAKRIAANAKTSARAADRELSDDNPSQSSHGGYNTADNFRLMT